LLEPLNRSALRIAREVADAVPGNLMAGNISNSNVWDPADPASRAEVRGMFEEMVGWAVEEGADLIVGETFYYAGEALSALEVAKASGLPVVLTLAPMAFQEMADGVGIVETAQRLEQGGADVVGLNCFRGPETMLPWLRQIREAVSCHVGALPIPYRTTAEEPTFFNLSDPAAPVPSPHGRTFPTALDPLYTNRYEIRQFTREALELGVNYLGVCCGAAPIHIREVAETAGRVTEASRFSERMENHFMYGSNDRLPEHIVGLGGRA
ncbi:MAG TPA: homocysteine S-methyltransferase family protein, partial [Candidatus Brachybacterium merdavium]|nr:homocysteine S-methyltransferase family protein [Candidatus Brachybacterium merdavium]